MASSDKNPDKKLIKYDLSTFGQKPNGFRDYVTLKQVKMYCSLEKFCFIEVFAEKECIKKWMPIISDENSSYTCTVAHLHLLPSLSLSDQSA